MAWFDTRLSYNPAIHRTKQALFHSAIVQDLNRQPLPPPHPELLKYLEPPRRILKRAREAIEGCQRAFNVREGTSRSRKCQRRSQGSSTRLVPKKVVRVRKDEHVRARDDDDGARMQVSEEAVKLVVPSLQKFIQKNLGKEFSKSEYSFHRVCSCL